MKGSVEASYLIFYFVLCFYLKRARRVCYHPLLSHTQSWVSHMGGRSQLCAHHLLPALAGSWNSSAAGTQLHVLYCSLQHLVALPEACPSLNILKGP